MSGIVEALKRNMQRSDAKSYFLGRERGMFWAEGADYFEMREWSEADIGEFDELVLPHEEGMHFTILSSETPLEWQAYLKGWLEGVKAAKRR